MYTKQNYSLRVNFNLKDISRVGGTRSQIWLSTTINGKRVRIYTRQLIHKEFWVKCKRNEIGGGCAKEDNTLGRVVNNENKAINKALKKILGYCNEYVTLVSADYNLQSNNATQIELKPETFKDYIESRMAGNDYLRKNNADTFITDYIERKKEETNPTTGKSISKGTLYNHQNAYRRLLKFVESKHLTITWDLFNKDFERMFTHWMNEQGYTPNTIASQYSIIKVWLGDAEKRGLIDDKSFHHYRTATHNVENIYLTEDEIQRLYDLDLTDEIANGQSKIEEARDLFIIGCWTGLRYGDYSLLPTIIDDETDIITVKTHKTNKSVTIPLHPIVKKIYKKYGGVLPKPMDKGKSMRHLRKCAQKAGIDTIVTLSSTKGGNTISQSKPKWEFIMNHTARRSFATNMYLKGVPTISIMSITAHTTEANFMKYLKVDGEQHAKIVAKAFENG